MSAVHCHYCNSIRYEIDNNQWKGIITEFVSDSKADHYDVEELHKANMHFRHMLGLIMEKAIQTNIIIKKMTVKLEYKDRNQYFVSVYCIMAHDLKHGISSYWIRKMTYEDIWKSLFSYDFLGSIFSDFAYMNTLPWNEICIDQQTVPVKNDPIEIPREITPTYIFTPECVPYLVNRTGLIENDFLMQKGQNDVENIVKIIKSGMYITRILAHTQRRDSVSFYCGTAFQILNGQRTNIFRNVVITITKPFNREFISCSSNTCRVEMNNYPWIVLNA